MKLIIANIIGFIAFIVSLIAYHRKNEERNIVIIKKERIQWLSLNYCLILFIIIYIISGIYTFTNIGSIFCIMVAIIYIISFYLHPYPIFLLQSLDC